MLQINVGDRIVFSYTNWKGTYSKRCVIVKAISFGSVPYHPGQQWILTAFDSDKREDRYFAMKDMFHIQKITKG